MHHHVIEKLAREWLRDNCEKLNFKQLENFKGIFDPSGQHASVYDLIKEMPHCYLDLAVDSVEQLTRDK